MEKNSIITIDSFQKLGEEEDNLSITARGRYYKKDAVHHLLYDEVDAENDVAIATYLKVDGDVIYLRRRGENSYEMTFDMAKKTVTAMNSPYGTVKLEIITDTVECSEYPSKLELVLEYSLYTLGEKISDNKMEIEIIVDKDNE